MVNKNLPPDKIPEKNTKFVTSKKPHDKVFSFIDKSALNNNIEVHDYEDKITDDKIALPGHDVIQRGYSIVTPNTEIKLDEMIPNRITINGVFWEGKAAEALHNKIAKAIEYAQKNGHDFDMKESKNIGQLVSDAVKQSGITTPKPSRI